VAIAALLAVSGVPAYGSNPKTGIDLSEPSLHVQDGAAGIVIAVDYSACENACKTVRERCVAANAPDQQHSCRQIYMDCIRTCLKR